MIANHDSRTLSVFENAGESTGDRDFVTSLCTPRQFFELSVPSTVGSQRRVLKFITPVDSGGERLSTTFQNVRLHPLHQDFLATMFPDLFPGLTSARYDALAMRRATREYFVGNLYELRRAGETLYGFSVITGGFSDRAELPRAEEVLAVRDALAEVFSVGPLVYYPETREERENAALWPNPGFEIFSENTSTGRSYASYTRGVGYGRVRLLDREEFDVANENGRFSAQDILVLERAPRDIEGVVGGVITAEEQTAASHVAVRTARRGTPNAFAVDALEVFGSLEGELIRLEVDESEYRWRSATLAEATDWWASNRPELSVAPTFDGEFRELPSLGEIDLDDGTPEARVGGKAANLARLQRVFSEEQWAPYRAPGFAVPMAYYLDFLRTGRIGSLADADVEISYEDYIHELTTDERFLSDAEFRFAKLAELREHMIDKGEVDAGVVRRIALRAATVFGTTSLPLRMRSSSNVEDALEFNGAGLYDSTSACAADDLDVGDEGPSRCDRNEGGERGIERALKRVWASLWNFRAYEERAFYGIDQSRVAMGVLVTLAFRGERANGVAFTADPTNPFDRRFLITTQVGEASVVSPEPGVLAETVLLEVWNGEVRAIRRASASSLAPPGAVVLDDQQLQELGRVLWHIQRELEIDAGGHDARRILLDSEFKIDETGVLAFKQVRPFLTSSPLEDAPDIALAISNGAAACARFTEFRGPRATFEHKSVVSFRSGAIDVSTAQSLWESSSLIDHVVVGPERRVARPTGPGVFRIERDTIDRGVFTIGFDQELVFDDDRGVVAASVRGVRADTRVSSEVSFDGQSLAGFLTLEADVDGVPVDYGPCALEHLRLWQIAVELEGGGLLRLFERHEPPLEITGTGPAELVRAEVSIGDVDVTVDDYWNLVYTAARHNVSVVHWVVFESPLVFAGVEGPVHAIEVVAPDRNVEPAVSYLGEGFVVLGSAVVTSYTRAEAAGIPFLRGDVEGDGGINLTDAILLLQHLFQGQQSPRAHRLPTQMTTAS